MSAVSLGRIREALEGAIPAIMATCAADGTPNVAFLSQVQYVDEGHVALSYQFFNKTRRNILTNPQGHLTVMHPQTAQIFRLRLHYLRTETSGPLFERMRAHLEGIASHTGMSGVFRLLGSDVYRVSEVEAQPGRALPPPPQRPSLLPLVRRASEALGQCTDLGSLTDTLLQVLQQQLGMEHAMVLLLDEAGQRLYTVGSVGYARSGIGSEVALGDGVVGTCAASRTTIRISWMTQAYRYSQTIRDEVLSDGQGNQLSTQIPYPGLKDPHSQVGVPLLHAGRLWGVLFVESEEDLRYTYDDEDALAILGTQWAAAWHALQAQQMAAETHAEAPGEPTYQPQQVAQGSALVAECGASAHKVLEVSCYAGSHSVFADGQYVIKGVAGAILWHLLTEYQHSGRTEFSNRQLRLNPAIGLPDVVDNLEARLILLRRRLAEQNLGVDLEKAGRGRLRLRVERQLQLRWVG